MHRLTTLTCLEERVSVSVSFFYCSSVVLESSLVSSPSPSDLPSLVTVTLPPLSFNSCMSLHTSSSLSTPSLTRRHRRTLPTPFFLTSASQRHRHHRLRASATRHQPHGHHHRPRHWQRPEADRRGLLALQAGKDHHHRQLLLPECDGPAAGGLTGTGARGDRREELPTVYSPIDG